MSEEGGSSFQKLFDGILSGQVARQVRLFAAQGLLPVSREDLLRLQAVLSADPDEELAEIASASLREQDPAVLVEWLQGADVSPIELDLIARVIRDERIWGAVAAHPNVSDETLCVMAEHASPMVQDIIITNQVRILACLEILEGLRSNPQVNQVVLRRVREFEEEFIEKVISLENDDFEQLDDFEPLSIEEPVSDIKEMGGQIPAEEELPFPIHDDPALADEIEKLGRSAFLRILDADVKAKIMIAIKGNREERAILINSRNKLILRSVLSSPKLSDMEVERFAQSRSVSDEVVRLIAGNPRWLRIYPVLVAVVSNPKTPLMTALRMMPQLSARDLNILSRDRNVNSVLRRRAKDRLDKVKR